eukprot:3939623-Rhodomonas_salina.1
MPRVSLGNGVFGVEELWSRDRGAACAWNSAARSLTASLTGPPQSRSEPNRLASAHSTSALGVA